MLEKIKNWVAGRFWPWLKREWPLLGSIIVFLICYGVLPDDGGLGTLVGIWLFILGGKGLWELFKRETPPRVEYVERVVEKIVEKPVEVIKYVEKPTVSKKTKK